MKNCNAARRSFARASPEARGQTPDLSRAVLASVTSEESERAIRARLNLMAAQVGDWLGVDTTNVCAVLDLLGNGQVGTPMNERQVKLLDRLLDGFEGKLTSSRWVAIARCSPDTALRDINELLALGVLKSCRAAAVNRSV